MLNSVAAMNAAFDAGQTHTQRFLKNAGTTGDARWIDWAFSSGQPAYDARIGPVLSFVPVVAQGNDAIYFPPIPAGMERRLHSLTMRPQASQASQASVDFILFDLVGYYPLIDGDSLDTQEMDNTLTLPRYTDGEGLRLVLVNHVAPAVQNGRMLLEYTDTQDADHTADIGLVNWGVNQVVTGERASVTTVSGGYAVPFDGGVTGVKRVNRITYTVAPGGLHAIYVIKPLATLQHFHDALLRADTRGVRAAIEKNFALQSAWNMSVIKDGAHLSFFYRPNGGGRTVALFGDLTFVWN
jgi:hypothetical protein